MAEEDAFDSDIFSGFGDMLSTGSDYCFKWTGFWVTDTALPDGMTSFSYYILFTTVEKITKCIIDSENGTIHSDNAKWPRIIEYLFGFVPGMFYCIWYAVLLLDFPQQLLLFLFENGFVHSSVSVGGESGID